MKYFELSLLQFQVIKKKPFNKEEKKTVMKIVTFCYLKQKTQQCENIYLKRFNSNALHAVIMK